MKLYKLKINEKNYEVVIKESKAMSVIAQVNGTDYQVNIEEMKNLITPTLIDEKISNIAPAQTSPQVAAPPVSAPSTGGDGVLAPIPGQIKGVHVKVGDSVKQGQKVLVLEAMKLENDIASPKTGTVKDVLVKVGDSVTQDQVLVTFN